jgi:hypothetical protein
MKKIEYIGISKRKSLRFKKNSFLLSQSPSSNGIINITVLSYGFLGPYAVNKNKGYFIKNTSMLLEDLLDCYEFKQGVKYIKE